MAKLAEQEKQEYQHFVDRLTEFCRSEGYHIGGCGCCGSPWIWKIEPKEAGGRYWFDDDGEQLHWGNKAFWDRGEKSLEESNLP